MNNPPKFLPIVVFISLLGTLGTSYFYFQYKSAQKQLLNPQDAVKAEAKQLMERVGRHMILPTGEEPTVATISDKEKLSGQPFFANAKNGDKVLIYNGAQKAILFDTIADRIIEVTSVNISNPTPTATSAAPDVLSSQSPLLLIASPSPVQLLKIGLYNGTNINGLTQMVEKTLKDKQISFVVGARDNTYKKEYAKSIIVDVSGSKRIQTQQIASSLNASVGLLPAGEEKLTAAGGENLDIVVIIGKEYVENALSPSPTIQPTSASGPTPAVQFP